MLLSKRFGIHICIKENLIHYRISVCTINYQIVWSVKYWSIHRSWNRVVFQKKTSEGIPNIKANSIKGAGYGKGKEKKGEFI